jgi:hypothetical protein
VSYIRLRLFLRGEPRPPGLWTARSLFQRFHRFAPDLMIKSPCSRVIPKVLVKIGRLRGLIYSSDKGERGCPKTYIHFMEREPVLACNARGTQMYILGGRYRVTSRGIEG